MRRAGDEIPQNKETHQSSQKMKNRKKVLFTVLFLAINMLVWGYVYTQNKASPFIKADDLHTASFFDCGIGNMCDGGPGCLGTDYCLHERATNCLPAEGYMGYTAFYKELPPNQTLGIEVKHTIVGLQNGKCIYDGEITAPNGGFLSELYGLTFHCELSNELLQKVFPEETFEQTIIKNCSGSYITALMKRVGKAW